MTAWNFATTWEIAADNLGDAPALAQGDRTVSWAEFDRRADGVARTLLDAGARQQDKVAQYLYNCPEYLEAMFACAAQVGQSHCVVNVWSIPSVWPSPFAATAR